MVAHFWLEQYGGMAWSAMTVGAGVITVGVHVIRCLYASSLATAVSAHIVLAFLNVAGAASLGVLIGFDKVYHFLPNSGRFLKDSMRLSRADQRRRRLPRRL